EVGANIGDTLAPIAIGAMISAMYWRNAIQLNTLIGVLLGLALLFVLREGAQAGAEGGTRHTSWAEYRNGVKGLLKNTVLLRLAMISSFRSMGQIGLMTTLPLYISFGLGIDDSAVLGLYITLLTGASLIGGPILGT